MPFTIDGEWIPSKKSETKPTSSRPVKVRCIKRGRAILTVVLNLVREDKELKDIASTLKKALGCGGGVKDGTIEIQGDKVAEVQTQLKNMGIKSQ